MDLEIIKKIDSSIVIVVLLTLITFYTYYQINIKEFKNKFLVTTTIYMIAEIIFIIAYEITLPNLNIPRTVPFLLEGLILIVGNIIVVVFLHFMFNYLGVKKLSKSTFILSIIPLLIEIWMLAENIFTHSSFKIVGDKLIYGSIYKLHIALILCNLLSIMIITILKRKNITSYEFRVLITFHTIMLVGALAQIYIQRINLFWNFTAYNIVFLYALLQNRIAEYDIGTKATSKYYFDNFIIKQIYEMQSKIGVFLIDIDSLRDINSSFGHTEGDLVLRKIVEFTYAVIPEEGKVIRYSGDEFVIIIPEEKISEMDSIAEKLFEKVDEYNKLSYKRYDINYTIKSAVYKAEDRESFSDLVRLLTKYIYEEKKLKRKKYNILYNKEQILQK